MKTLNFRLLLLTLLILAALFAPGQRIFLAYHKQITYQQDLALSYRARDLIETTLERGFRDLTEHELRGLHAQITHRGLQESLQRTITTYPKRNRRELRKQLSEFKQTQQLYSAWLKSRVAAQQDEIANNAWIGLISIVLLTLYMAAYVQRKILKPIRQLSSKMNDFLHDRYTYQFITPDHNEVGELQSTFNVLAQRVIHNMDELRTLDEAKSEFLSIASHELRTPLTAIKGSLNLLASQTVGALDGRVLKLVHIAETETDRLIRLINDLLDITRIEAGRLPLRPTWFPLVEALQACKQSLQGLLDATRLQLHIRIPSEVQIQVYMDKDRFVQILTNLLSNAIKFSPSGGEVTIHGAPDPSGGFRIEVEDQGRGIPLADQTVIFQKFRQSTDPTNPLVKGTGLGLAIAKALIEEHGGTIGLRSQPQVGSTFYFVIPEWRDPQDQTQGRRVESEPKRRQEKRRGAAA